MFDRSVVGQGFTYRSVQAIRKGLLAGRWLFAWVLLAQLGHLVEHISVAIQARGLLGPQFDSELSHLVCNSAIAVLATVLVFVYARNACVYPLLMLSILHGIDH